MTVLCLGVSHRSAAVALRERMAYVGEALDAALDSAARDARAGHFPFAELAILSTCNRVELYAVPEDPDAAPAELFTALAAFVERTRGVSAAALGTVPERASGTVAARHLCRVATGLASVVLGEAEIAGQVADAHSAARRHGTAGVVLDALFSAAVRAARRARAETAIGRNPASVSSVAVQLAEQLADDLGGRRVLVLGAGKMGAIAARALRARGDWQLRVSNRTSERAAELASQLRGEAVSFDELAAALAWADVVIASTGASEAVVTADLVRGAMRDRAERPLVLIDIAVPRDVDPAARAVPGVRVYDMDDLQARVERTVEHRRREVPRVEAIVAEEVARFEEAVRRAPMRRLLTDLRHNAEAIRQREVGRALEALPIADAVTRDRLEELSLRLVNRLLHEPTRRLRAEAGNGHAGEYERLARQLFGLADRQGAPPDDLR